MKQQNIVEYIWLDGQLPAPRLRSKTRVLALGGTPKLSDLPRWTFDGTQTQQADNHDHDCLLAPVRLYPDPLRGAGHYLALCEVLDAGGCTHLSNNRAPLRSLMLKAGAELDPWLGFEQPYRAVPKMATNRATAWPLPSGYCAIDTHSSPDNSGDVGLAEAHLNACLEAGLLFYGMNAEATQHSWRFQMGYRDCVEDRCDALSVADDLWVARYLLERLADQKGFYIDYHLDQSCAHLHVSFSTLFTRDERCGLNAIDVIAQHLDNNTIARPRSYNCPSEQVQHFSSGITQRTSAIRIPTQVVQRGHGYLVDCRPCADADPYELGRHLIGLVQDDDAEMMISAPIDIRTRAVLGAK